MYGFGGLERWNGMVEWTGLDWNGMAGCNFVINFRARDQTLTRNRVQPGLKINRV